MIDISLINAPIPGVTRGVKQNVKKRFCVSIKNSNPGIGKIVKILDTRYIIVGI